VTSSIEVLVFDSEPSPVFTASALASTLLWRSVANLDIDNLGHTQAPAVVPQQHSVVWKPSNSRQS
jgi:hypothetical protein